MKTVAIVGSRDITDVGAAMVWNYVAYLAREGLAPDCIISGGARGVDRAAEEAAKTNEIPFIRFDADWERDGKQAGFLRNKAMVKHADHVVAFWDGQSLGTKLTIDLALEHHKDLEVFFV